MSTFCICIIVLLCIWALRNLFRKKVVDVKGKNVLITGAASGIGRMLANDMIKKVRSCIAFDD